MKYSCVVCGLTRGSLTSLRQQLCDNWACDNTIFSIIIVPKSLIEAIVIVNNTNMAFLGFSIKFISTFCANVLWTKDVSAEAC